MRNIKINESTIGRQGYNLVEGILAEGGVISSTNVYNLNPYPSDGVFLLDENANVLDKNVDSYPAGTIKAYGFKAGDGNYYAVDAEAIPDMQYWGGYDKLIDSLESLISTSEASKDYAGESNTDKIIKVLANYNDGNTTGAPAAEVCRAKTFNGKQGFLPALGQFKDFFSYKLEVDSLAKKFSLDAFPINYYHWTSTQESAISSWGLQWYNGLRAILNRGSHERVRAFFAL